MAKGINGKNKGNEYERKIAKSLSGWWGEQFQRTPASGGLQWKNDNRVSGDIVTSVKSKFPFTVECKKREGWSIEQLVKETGDIEKWWAQVIKDCERSSLRPLLIFSRNFAPDYVMIHEADFNLLASTTEVKFTHFILRSKKYNRVILMLDDLYKLANKQEVLDRFGIK
ncbi:hypothetical protein EalM132_00111 [Exiguobacterium phage vB_EalM-132]|nr:hypothetical protein EalM132_00111 [Exiguobacterium phage vB_EalM-132]